MNDVLKMSQLHNDKFKPLFPQIDVSHCKFNVPIHLAWSLGCNKMPSLVHEIL